MSVIDEVRSFNRFYTREIGLLAEHLPGGDFSLPEARVLYELDDAGEQMAADIVRRLGMDKAHLSRIVARLRARGLVESRVSPSHGKHLLLSLTEAGHAAFAALDRGTRRQMDSILAPLPASDRERLVSAMQDVTRILGTDPGEAVRLRDPVPGDLGWIAHRQAALYALEYGWDWTFEGLICDILGKFVAHFDPAREAAWVAERAGTIVGSVFLVQGERADTGKLRLLYVEPSARGLGIGRMLVRACIARARDVGYRNLMLWTNDILHAARRIYQAEGFVLVEESPHHSFGHDLVGQNWVLDLADRGAG